MNLDDFKIQINKQLEATPNFELPVSGITNLHTIKTNSILEKIKKSLQFEIFFGLAFIIVFALLAFFADIKGIRIYFGFFSIILALFIIVLFYLFIKTKNASFIKLSVKENIVSLHSLLSQFVKRCFQFTMLLIPICFISSLYLAYNDMQYHATNSTQYFDIPLPKKYIIILIIVIAVFSVLMYFFTKWYLNKLYGNHLQQLKQMIDDIEL
jgi:MFS family permease